MVLKARRALARGKSRARSVNRIIIRTPPLILDTRLRDAHDKGTYLCDDCDQYYHGPFQGEFIEATRDPTYDIIASGWRDGTVDASWFCVDCWGEKLGLGSNSRTREAIGLPAASKPAEVTDNRFHQHTTRWSMCDNCDTYCTGRARDYLPGSFVYATDNIRAGPPKSRKGCFPTLGQREDLWRNGTWNARYLCRTCLVREWDRSPHEIDQWLVLYHPGPAKAASYQRSRWTSSNTRSGWHAHWDKPSHGSGWNYSAGRWT